MTPVKNQNGFTIVEVILFLAITGLVFLIGFSGIGGRNREVQYTTSIRTIDSYLQGQLNEMFNGTNLFGDGSDNSRVVLGKVIVFKDAKTIEVHTIAGDRLTESQIDTRIEAGTTPDRWLIYDANPQSVGSETTTIDWGTTFHSTNIGANSSSANAVAIMRSPNSSRIFPIAWNYNGDVNSLISNPALYEPGSGGLYGYLDSPEFYMCFKGANDKYAAISFGAGDRQTAFETYFDPVHSPDTGKTSCGPTL